MHTSTITRMRLIFNGYIFFHCGSLPLYYYRKEVRDMLVHTEILKRVLKLDFENMKYMWPGLYLWFDANRKRVGMHRSKFRRELIDLFNREDHLIDLSKCQINRVKT